MFQMEYLTYKYDPYYIIEYVKVIGYILLEESIAFFQKYITNFITIFEDSV